MVDLTLSLQGSVLHKNHGCGPSLPGEPRSRPHPEPNRILPDEHSHYTTLHLPVSPRWEWPQHQGTDRRRLWTVCQRKRGVRLYHGMIIYSIFTIVVQKISWVFFLKKNLCSLLIWNMFLQLASYTLVCQTSGEIHPGPEHHRSESLDQSDEENDPDSRVPRSAVWTVEVSQRNWCCKSSWFH